MRTGLLGRGLFGDGVQTLWTRMLNVALSAALAILVSRALGPHGRGLYVLPGILAGLGSMAFSGLKTVISRAMLHEGRGRGAVTASLLSSIPLVALGAVASTVLAFVLHQTWAAPWAIAALPFMAMPVIASGYAYGLGDVRIPNWMNLALATVTLAFIGCGLVFEGRAASVAIFMWLAATIVVGVACLAWMLLQARKLPPDRVAFRPFFAYAIRLSGLYTTRMLNYRIGMYVITGLLSVTALGLYTAAVSGAESLFVVTEIASVVSVPRIGSLPRDEAAAFTARCMRNNAFIAGIVALVAILLAPYAVVLLYGHPFAPAILPLQILCVGTIALSQIGVVTNYYTLNAGKPIVPFLMQLASMLMCVALSFLFVPMMGIVGAGVATTVAYIASVGAVICWFARETRIPWREIVLIRREDVVWYRARLTGKTAAA
jgi:O-antigen/teichoic acid export membrane protein